MQVLLLICERCHRVDPQTIKLVPGEGIFITPPAGWDLECDLCGECIEAIKAEELQNLEDEKAHNADYRNTRPGNK